MWPYAYSAILRLAAGKRAGRTSHGAAPNGPAPCDDLGVRQPMAVPKKEPMPKVSAAAAPPRASWRRPLNHHERAVTLATTAPQPKRPISASSTAGHSAVAPSRY